MNVSYSRIARPAAMAALFLSTGTAAAADQADVLNEIVVTASPIAHDADHFATIVDTVDRREILQQGGANLADALATTPGVTGTSFAAGASRPVIRGFDANRVRTLEDGIGSFDVSDVGPDHGVPIDPLSAQRIEVVRGAATLRYGSQAIGGVVNAINNRVPMTLPDTPVAGEVSASLATDADAREGSALVDGRAGQFGLHADAFVRHTVDYDTPGGTQQNSFFRGDGLSLGSSYFFGDSHVGAAVVHYDAKYGIPSDTTYIDMQQTKELLRSSFAIKAGALQTITVDGGYADYQHVERDPDGTPLSTFLDKEWDGRGEAIFGPMGKLSGAALGMQLQHKDFSALGDALDYLLPTTTRSAAAFGFADLVLGNRAHLEAGARIERVQVQGTPASDILTQRDFTPHSASLGWVFDATPAVGLGLMFSSAARAPGQTELFARGPHDGPGTFETGDPTLSVERANSLEGTLRLRFNELHVDSSLWAAKFSDYIYGQLTGRTCEADGICVNDDSLDLRELNYRQSDATFRGAEVKAKLPIRDNGAAGKLSVEALADVVRATLADGGGNVPRIPPYHLGAGVRWANERLDTNLYVKYTARQDDTATGETPTAGYTSVDAFLGWRPLAAKSHLELSLVGHNLTDSVQHNAVSINKDEVTLPGRNVRLVLRATL